MDAAARLASLNLSQLKPEATHGHGAPPNTSYGQTSTYTPISSENEPNPVQKAEYYMKRYLWRSFLTITGPLVVLAFYALICFHFLAHPLVNNVFPSQTISPTWIYYCWFLISIFILEWGRTCLANIEASALMLRYLAPPTARELMWHADTYWANPLGWLRVLRSLFLRVVRRNQFPSQHPTPMPSTLWMLLSLIHMLLFVAIPLSGLSIEVVNASAYSKTAARIYGPDADSFNSRSWVDFPQRIHNNWVSGRQTSPSHGALLYAPYGSSNVSENYFDDQAVEAARSADGTMVRVFAGPVVRELVWGEAWGLSTNVSCMPTPLHQLQMIKSNGYNSSVNICSTQKGCRFQWLSLDEANRRNDARMQGLDEPILDIPVWLNESRYIHPQRGLPAHSLLAAADGWTVISTPRTMEATISPYNGVSNHDNWTFDHIVKRAPSEDVTNSMFEMLLWQAGETGLGTFRDDEIFKNYKDHPSSLITVHNGSTKLFKHQTANDSDVDSGVYVGFGVHCDIKSAVGTADLDPDTRTFSSFKRGYAAPSNVTFLFPFNLGSVQVQAMASMSGNQYWGNVDGALAPREEADMDATLAGVHKSIGSSMRRRADDDFGAFLYYPTLTTEDLTLAMYKLVGESVIALMGEGGLNPSTSTTLHTVTPAKNLRPGAVPWQLVLILLAVWAISTSLSALVAVLFAGPRWAPTLSGFELFKFGAQYQDEVHQFETVDFQRCTRSLTAIPGMVGVLLGTGKAGAGEVGFIGLSEKVADKWNNVRYTLDRERAAKGKPI
jgi:hypothetical protein